MVLKHTREGEARASGFEPSWYRRHLFHLPPTREMSVPADSWRDSSFPTPESVQGDGDDDDDADNNVLAGIGYTGMDTAVIEY
jgi:hypothetical protein